MTDISHIVVNGCSLAYGQGLDNPLTEAWPHLVSKSLNVPLVNLAVPGSSNEGICRRTYEYFHSGAIGKPLVIISLTFYSRLEAWYNEKYGKVNLYDTISSHASDRKKDVFHVPYVKNINDENFLRKTLLNILAIKFLLENLGLPYLIADYSDDQFLFDKFKDIEYISKMAESLFDHRHMGSLSELTRCFPKLRCGHDNHTAQLAVSDYILANITQLYGTINPIHLEYTSLEAIDLGFDSIWKSNRSVLG